MTAPIRIGRAPSFSRTKLVRPPAPAASLGGLVMRNQREVQGVRQQFPCQRLFASPNDPRFTFSCALARRRIRQFDLLYGWPYECTGG